MIRGEILNMPAGREMDAWVAEKVMGWYVSVGSLIDRKHKPGDVFLGDVCEFWSPSTNIAAAWEVVEKLKEIHFRLYYKAEPFNEFDEIPIGWICSMSGFEFVPEYAPTAPLAICRAALLAVMED